MNRRTVLSETLVAVFTLVVAVSCKQRGCSALSTRQSTMKKVKQIDAENFDAASHYLHSPKDKFLETPVLIKAAISSSECEEMCNALWSVGSNLSVDVQRKERGETDIYHCNLIQGVTAVMDSNHQDSRLIFEEGLLDKDESLGSISKRLAEVQEALFTDEDCLEHFPPQVKPSSCVVIAGEGATSTLHRDPLEWTGTSICLEGSKVWRFVPPSPNVTAVDEMLNSYRLTSIAWDEFDVPLSAGWQSDFNLYAKRGKGIPNAQSLDDMGLSVKREALESIAADTSQLQPDASDLSELWTVVQQTGDLLVIPAHWWHQTYGLEPSIAVASQRCGTERDLPRLVRHIMETSGIAFDKSKQQSFLRDSYEPEKPKAILNKLFAEIASAVHE